MACLLTAGERELTLQMAMFTEAQAVDPHAIRAFCARDPHSRQSHRGAEQWTKPTVHLQGSFCSVAPSGLSGHVRERTQTTAPIDAWSSTRRHGGSRLRNG